MVVGHVDGDYLDLNGDTESGPPLRLNSVRGN